MSNVAMPAPASTNAASAGDDTAATIAPTVKASATFPPPKTDKPRPHVCSTCQRSFARLEHLKRHERSHTKEKPFECPECARCFARRDLLLRHQQKLHQTSTPSSRPRNRRESTTGVGPGQSRARKNSVAGPNPANAGANSMRPRANTISHVDGTAMQMIAAANASSARSAAAPSHNRHASMASIPLHGLDSPFNGMAAAMGQRGMMPGLPKLETAQMMPGGFGDSLRTAPPISYTGDFDFEALLFGQGTTINPNALHYNDSPPFGALDQMSPFPTPLNETSQALDDNFDWLTGFEHQMSFQTGNEKAVGDGSSPSAISTTSQSAISDVMVDGSNHNPVAAGSSSMWQSSIMGPPQLPNPFAMDLNGSVFPDLLNGDPMSPQPASQKINDPYFSTPPPSLNSLSPSVMPGLNTQAMNQIFGFNAEPETPSTLNGGNHGATPVTTITEATRNAIVTALSQCQPFGGRKFSNPHISPPSAHTHASSAQLVNLPSLHDLQRYVNAYISCFHPHLPFLHIPTLSFESPTVDGHVDGSGCLVLSMSAIGALYEENHDQSKHLFEMAKKMMVHYLEERRKADVRKADVRRAPPGSDSAGFSLNDDGQHTPVWLVQAMLLNVVYGHNCADKTAGDIASTHCTALVSLAHAADLTRSSRAGTTEGQDIKMTDNGSWHMKSEQEEQLEWLQWKTGEERKRTLYAVFIMSSLLVIGFNHTPALTNSEVFLDLPCDEAFYAADSSSAFAAMGGAKAADYNRVTFHDALGELLRTNEKQLRQTNNNVTGPQHDGPGSNELLRTDLQPSTFGCLVLINALHNYIWETRQRHHNKVWTNEETEKMHRHIEPALKAWQAAWASNPHHSLERPNPFGHGPLSADAVPLLDLAYVRLFVNLSRSKDRFWKRDWEGLAEELSRGSEFLQHAEQSPASLTDSNGTDPSETSLQSSMMIDSPGTQASSLEVPASKMGSATANRPISRREKHLRKAAFYAADSFAMSEKLGVTFADFTSRELPLQAAMCTLDCAQVLAEWIATLQDRVGQYLGILGEDTVDFTQVPAVMLLEEEDTKLFSKIKEALDSAEAKIRNSADEGNSRAAEAISQMEGYKGYAARLLCVTAYMLDKSAVWPVTQLMARCLESHANHVRARAQKSVPQLE